MANMLLPDQIPIFWEAIKYSVTNAEEIEEDKREGYFNRLLYLLLAGKAQCFVRLDSDRKLQAIALTSVREDPVYDCKILFCYGLFSFAKVDIDTWKKDFGALIKFAKRNKCKRIVTWAINPKAISILIGLGMGESYKMFHYDLGGVE